MIYMDMKEILKEFKIDEFTNSSLIKGGFNKNWIIETSKEKYFLKRRSTTEKRRIETDSKASKHLSEKKVPSAAPIKARNGEYTVKRGNYAYSLFDYIESEEYREDPELLRKAGETLFKMHKNLKGFEHTLHNKDAVEWSREQCREPIPQKTLSRAKKTIEKAGEEIKNENPPKTTIHWDYHGGNIRVKENELYVFDFEFTHEDYRIMDIANSLICFTALSSENIRYSNALSFIQSCEIDEGKARIFLNSYNNIQNKEKNLLPEALLVSWWGWVFYTLHQKNTYNIEKERMNYFPKWVENNKEKIRGLI